MSNSTQIISVSHTESNVLCRWLHFSDLHISGEDSKRTWLDIIFGKNKSGELDPNALSGLDHATLLREYGIRGVVLLNPIDAILITGDFVNRGNFSNENRALVKDVIQSLYSACFPTEVSDGKTYLNRLFFCSGNHEIIRDASFTDAITGVVIKRSEHLNKPENVKNGYFSVEDSVKHIFTIETFSPFINLIKDLPISINDEDIEGHVFTIKTDSSAPNVHFVAMNTALLAGQLKTYDEEKLNQYKKGWEEAHSKNKANAKELYVKYCEEIDAREKRAVYDDGKMVLPSRTFFDRITREVKDEDIIILAGHHGFDFLCSDAKSALDTFASQHGIFTYLCGHSHVPTQITRDTGKLLSSTLTQFVAGSTFFNEKDFYSQLSFYIGSISKEENNNFFLKQEMFCYSRYIRGWYLETMPKQLVKTSQFTSVPEHRHTENSDNMKRSEGEAIHNPYNPDDEQKNDGVFNFTSKTASENEQNDTKVLETGRHSCSNDDSDDLTSRIVSFNKQRRKNRGRTE